MPSKTPTLPKIDPAKWYVCIENHTGDRGTYREGDRLRGSHPDVQLATLWWVEEGFDADQLNEVRQTRIHSTRS
jgi:hypothetical protein